MSEEIKSALLLQGTLSWPEHLAMNIVFLLMAVAGIIIHSKEHRKKTKQPYPVRAMA